MKFTTRFITALTVLGLMSAASSASAAAYIKLGDIKGESRAMESQTESEYYQMLEEEAYYYQSLEEEQSGFPTDIDSGTDGGWGISGGLDRDIIRRIQTYPPKPKPTPK